MVHCTLSICTFNKIGFCPCLHYPAYRTISLSILYPKKCRNAGKKAFYFFIYQKRFCAPSHKRHFPVCGLSCASLSFLVYRYVASACALSTTPYVGETVYRRNTRKMSELKRFAHMLKG